jgi:hypothetical protein
MKPVVLWTCDVKGWAYDNRVQTMARALPGYEHRVWIMSNVPSSLHLDMMMAADIVVCQGVKVVARTLAAGAVPPRIVARVDSVRIDHEGRYFDVFVPTPAVGAAEL